MFRVVDLSLSPPSFLAHNSFKPIFASDFTLKNSNIGVGGGGGDSIATAAASEKTV